MGFFMKKKRILIPVILLIFVLIIWQLLVRALGVSLYILPAPSDILRAMAQSASDLMFHSMTTLAEALIGLGISTGLAILLAIGMDISKTFKSAVFPHMIVTQTVPVMVLGPLFALWFGFGLTPKVLIVIFMCFFPIAITFTDALGHVDPDQVNLLKGFGAGRRQIYTMVKIPAAAPGLFSGLKVASTYCIGGAIVGEWLSASSGLGYYMIRLKNGYMLDKVFACVVMIILWSLLLHLLVVLIEYIVFPYKRKRRTS